jgi:hypothetical protein
MVRTYGLATAASLAASSGMALSACGGNNFTTGNADASLEAGVATAEASGRDAPAPSDAPSPSDAGSPGDAASASWCAGQLSHTFCEDFDEYASVNELFGAWSSFQQTNGSFKFDSSNAPSPPNALEVIGANGAQVIVVKTFPVEKQPSTLRLEFDLRFNSSGNVGFLSAVGLAAIAFGPSVSDGYAALVVGNGPSLSGAWLDTTDAGTSDAGTFKIANATGTFPASGVWSARYAIEVDYTSSTSGCVQVFQGTTALLSPCLPLPPQLLHPSVVSISLGDYAAGFASTGSIDVEFDNVTFDIE